MVIRLQWRRAARSPVFYFLKSHTGFSHKITYLKSMSNNPYAPKPDDLPDDLPIFPLRSALLLPHGSLPLNIFEPRYIQMIDDAMAGARMIGIIQPLESGEYGVQSIGCAGKIVEFSETTDGRYGITLSGISRFTVREELEQTKLYRRVTPCWDAFEGDVAREDCLDIDREKLCSLLKSYFQMEDLSCCWDAIGDSTDQKLITALCMICPFESQEKQALLEAKCCRTRANLFMDIVKMHVGCGCAKTQKGSKAH